MLMDYEKALEEAVGGCMIGVEWGEKPNVVRVQYLSG